MTSHSFCNGGENAVEVAPLADKVLHLLLLQHARVVVLREGALHLHGVGVVRLPKEVRALLLLLLLLGEALRAGRQRADRDLRAAGSNEWG